MKYSLAIALFAVLCAVLPAGATDDLTPSQHEAFREFIAASQIESQINQVIPVIVDQMSKFSSGHISNELRKEGKIPPEKTEAAGKIIAEETSAFMNEIYPKETKGLIDKIAVIYYRYFSEDEIRKITQFYQTPTGKRMARLQGTMFQEGAKAGEKWGIEIFEKNKLVYQQQVKERLREELGVE